MHFSYILCRAPFIFASDKWKCFHLSGTFNVSIICKVTTFFSILVPSLIALLSPFMSSSKHCFCQTQIVHSLLPVCRRCSPSWLLIAILQTHSVLNLVFSLLSAPKHLYAPVDQSSSISNSLTNPITLTWTLMCHVWSNANLNETITVITPPPALDLPAWDIRFSGVTFLKSLIF